MNRKIKFRAWDKQNKTMGIVNEIKMSPYLYTQVKYSMEINGKRKDEWSLLDDNGHGTCVLMQYTGLLDKNDKEIYEGDVVKVTGNYKPGTYTVIWDNFRVAWWLKNIKQRELEYHDDYYQLLNNSWQVEDREVIGNIHDNPELLEVENETNKI